MEDSNSSSGTAPTGGSGSSQQVFPKSPKAQAYHLGIHKVDIPAFHYACELYVRPDVKEESLMQLVEQVFLSLGGIIPPLPAAASSSTLPTIQMKNPSDASSWKEVHAYLGGNVNFQKVLFLLVIPTVEQGSSLVHTFNQYMSLGEQEYDHQASFIFTQCLQALITEGFGMEAFNYLEYLSTDKNIDVLQVKVNTWKALPMHQSAESIIDLGFIRDLQSTAAHLMNSKILQEVELVDKMMKSFELKCAKLMTLLKPSYQRASLSLPSPPEVKSLNTYPLTLKRDSIRDLLPETWKIMVLRARKTVRDRYVENLNPFHHVQLVTLDLILQFQQWAEEEYAVRIGRKIQSVKDRFEALQRFKLQLILSLHDRFNLQKANNQSDGGNGGGLMTGLSGLGSNGIWSFAAFNADRKFQMTLQEKFPFLDFFEPSVYDCSAIINQKTGMLYVTSGHLLFHSTSHLLVSNMVIVVIPLKTIQQIDMLRSDLQVTTSTKYQEEFDSLSTTTTTATPGTPLNEKKEGDKFTNERITGSSLRIIDQGQVETIIRFTDTTPEFAARVFDLLDLLLKVSDIHLHHPITVFYLLNYYP